MVDVPDRVYRREIVIHPGMAIKVDKTRRSKDQGSRLGRGFKAPESGVVLLAVLSLVVLLILSRKRSSRSPPRCPFWRPSRC